MAMRWMWAGALGYLMGLSVMGCQAAVRLPFGQYCDFPEECSSGVCRGSRCTEPCAVDDDCAELPGYYCRAGFCDAPCPVERGRSFDDVPRICVAGREVACTALDDSYCDVCEDQCPGQRCVERVGCAPLAALDEPCEADDDCNTGNCSTWAGVCRVPLGAECDETNCDVCMGAASGWRYCSRECTATYGRTCGTDRCLGSRDSDFYYCRPDCGGDCPGSCEYSTDGSIRYCSGGPIGIIMAPPRPLLAPCRLGSECDGSLCLGSRDCEEATSCAGYRGVCSVTCTSDAQCGAGGRCVSLPCPDGATTNCGNVCLPMCTAARDCAPASDSQCRSVPLAAGGEAMVCDPRNETYSLCSNGTHCLSGVCDSSGRCAEAGGSANGTSCGADTDCMSGNCQTGICRGTALRGGSCTTMFDCSVGTCVSGICD